MTEFENNKRAEDAAAEKPAAPAQPATVPPLQGMPTPPQSAGQVPPAGNPYANASQPQQPSGQAPFYGAPAQQPQGAPQNMPGMPLLYLTGGNEVRLGRVWLLPGPHRHFACVAYEPKQFPAGEIRGG